MKVMFLDESGDHRLKTISSNYPVFVLGGVIVDRAYVRHVIEPQVRGFKQQFWNRDNVILHTVDMRNNAGDFSFPTDQARRAAFYAELNVLLNALAYNVIAVVVKKNEFVARYGTHVDPYLFALKILIDRFCDELDADLDAGFISAEKRNRTFDLELLAAWEAVRSEKGTDFTDSMRINDRIIALDLRDKKPNLAGMQLADLVITPIGRHVLGWSEKKDQVHWSVVERKLRQVDGIYWEHGLIVRPETK